MKHKYSVQIAWSQEDDAFIASVPELPGCMADGATQEDAIKNLELVIEDWIETATTEGREVPAPFDSKRIEVSVRHVNEGHSAAHPAGA